MSFGTSMVAQSRSRSRGRVGENPGNEVELCTAKYCLLLKAFEKKEDCVQLTALNFKNISFLLGNVIRSVISLLVLLIVFIRGSGGIEVTHKISSYISRA